MHKKHILPALLVAFVLFFSQNASAARPEHHTTVTRDGLRLSLKRYASPGGRPLLVVHGFASNDIYWDSPVEKYSFAKFLHARGFDVWIGNLRGAGSRGFRSESPAGPRHWTVEDYAAFDLPALVEKVQESTQRTVTLVGHSLAAWVFEGYLSGVYLKDGRPAPDPVRAAGNAERIRSVVTIAGMYKLTWPKKLKNFLKDPVRNHEDYRNSNYAFEAAALAVPIWHASYRMNELPLDYLGHILDLPLGKIPYIGKILERVSGGFWRELAGTPLFEMLYNSSNMDPQVVLQYARKSLEDPGPRLLEQLRNAILTKKSYEYYHLRRPRDAYDYSVWRRNIRVPVLFVAGERDMLAHQEGIRSGGFKQYSEARNRAFILVPEAGHLDVVNGINSRAKTWIPVVEWIDAN